MTCRSTTTNTWSVVAAGEPNGFLADVEQLQVVGVEVADQGCEAPRARIERRHDIVGALGREAIEGTPDDAVACFPDVGHQHVTDLQVDTHAHDGFREQRVTNPRATTQPASDLDEAFRLEDAQCFAHYWLRDAEAIHQLSLDRQRFAGWQLTPGDPGPEVRRDGQRRLRARRFVGPGLHVGEATGVRSSTVPRERRARRIGGARHVRKRKEG